MQRAFPKLTFKNPLDIAFEGDRVFIAEQAGRIYSFRNIEGVASPDLAADLPREVKGLEKVPLADGVSALYGIAFHPNFRESRFIYVCYVLNVPPPAGHRAFTPRDQQGSRVSRFTVTQSDPPRIDPASEQVIITWFAGGHNGGCLKFGPDGYLYISTGDGGDPDPPDPFNTGQDINDLLSSILRIDVDHPSPDGKPYSIPPDNPFIHTTGARPEVWAYGLRNPWRMSFDRQTGNLWVGDVGWELWESVVCARAGGNYGWSIMEGPNPVHPDGKRGPTPLTPPVLALSHAEAASLTGGVVYHGKRLSDLSGHYIFGDWQTSRLWAAKCTGGDKLEPHREIAQTEQRIVAFGEQNDGELLIVDHQGGGLWRIVPNQASSQPSHFPHKLSQTGLFTSVKDQTPAPGVLPFAVNAPQWVDGASAQRWIAVPGAAGMAWGKGVWGDDKPAWPAGSVLVRTLSMSAPLSGGGSGGGSGSSTAISHVETQLLHFDGKQWRAYSYAWNADQADAELIDAAGDDRPLAIADPKAPGGVRKQQWRFASRTQCMTCHNVWSDYALAFNAAQLDRDEQFGSFIDNQIRTFRHIGLLLGSRPGGSDEPPPQSSSNQKLALSDPYDAALELNERARSYLHVNCSQCHRFGGGGSALFDVRKELPLERTNLVDVKPNLGDFGIDRAKLVSRGDPARSVLLYRMAKLGTGRMPHIGSDHVDERGLALMRQWIDAMPGSDIAHGAGGSDCRPLLDEIRRPRATPQEIAAAADKLLASPHGGLALALALLDEKIPPARLEAVTRRGAASALPQVRDLFRRFDPADQQSDRLGPNINPAKLLALHGNAERGRQLFFDQAAGSAAAAAGGLCARCHIVNGRGSEFGPDLSHIASKYNRADLLDNILNPSKTIAPGYATYILRTRAGDTYSGLLVKKTDAQVVLKDAQLKLVTIPTQTVERLAPQSISAMPEGILGELKVQQGADLLEFLDTLR